MEKIPLCSLTACIPEAIMERLPLLLLTFSPLTEARLHGALTSLSVLRHSETVPRV